jgi:hypothetical protein
MVGRRIRRLALFCAAALAAASCGRTPAQSPSRKADLLSATPGTRSTSEVSLGSEADDSPSIRVVIDRTFRNQKPLETAPWRSDGGDWAFFEGHVKGVTGAKILVGIRSGRPGPNPIAWGDALLAVPDRTAGARVVEEFAKVFGQKVPRAKDPQRLVALRFRTAVLGVGLVRDREGGFGETGGTWTATKWFLQPDGYEAEIFFNYDLDGGIAEFSEKDEEYRADLVAILSRVLRDGPRPERTTQNDPSLQAEGPRFSDWKLLSSEGSEGRFSADGAYVAFTEKIPGGGERLLRRPLDGTGQPTEIFRTDGRVSDSEPLDAASSRFVILESHPKQPGSWSSDDPSELYIAEPGSKKRLAGPWGSRPSLPASPLSPDRRYLALTALQDRTDGQRGRYQLVHVLDLSTGASRRMLEDNKSWSPVQWVNEKGKPRLLLADGFSFQKTPRTYWLLDPVTGVPSPAPRPPDPKATARAAPGGALSFRLADGPELAFEAGGRPARSFSFHEDDARFAEEGCCDWVSERYVFFRGPRPAFVDSATGKMSFPAPTTPALGSLTFSADFRRVLSHREDGLWLGKVTVP